MAQAGNNVTRLSGGADEGYALKGGHFITEIVINTGAAPENIDTVIVVDSNELVPVEIYRRNHGAGVQSIFRPRTRLFDMKFTAIQDGVTITIFENSSR